MYDEQQEQFNFPVCGWKYAIIFCFSSTCKYFLFDIFRPLKPIKKKDTTEKKDEQIRIQLYQNLPNYEWHKYGRIDELKFR